MAGRAPSPLSQQQQSIANDHIPLAFLLGSRAKHYAPNKVARNDNNAKRGNASSPPANKCSSSSSRSALNTTTSQQQQQKKRSVELFVPEKNLREREKEARRVLRQMLLLQNADAAKSSYCNNSGACMTSGSSVPSAATLSPMGVLKANKEQVLHQVLEMQQLEQEEPRGAGVGDDDAEPSYRGRGVDPNEDDGNGERIKSFHGYQRADHQASFLDVSGRATHIPVLSNLKAKALHQSVLKKQYEWRANRVDEIHAFLQSQQQFTKHQLQLVSLSKDPKVPKHLAKVDLGIDEHEETGDYPIHIGAIANANSLAEVREQHQRDQLLLHERVQEKKQLEQLTRQQKLAFHQQQKREFGRVKGVKRPNFLATLQLDSNNNGDADSTTGVGGSRVLGDRSLVSEKELREKKKTLVKNQEESDHSHESESKLKQLQRDKFLQSEGGLHFGGGFKSKQKQIAAINTIDLTSTNHSGAEATANANATPTLDLSTVLECGMVSATTRHSRVASAGRKRAP